MIESSRCFWAHGLAGPVVVGTSFTGYLVCMFRGGGRWLSKNNCHLRLRHSPREEARAEHSPNPDEVSQVGRYWWYCDGLALMFNYSCDFLITSHFTLFSLSLNRQISPVSMVPRQRRVPTTLLTTLPIRWAMAPRILHLRAPLPMHHQSLLSIQLSRRVQLTF
jgi:hypothetical protein